MKRRRRKPSPRVKVGRKSTPSGEPAEHKPTPEQIAEAVRIFSRDPVGALVGGAFFAPLARMELEGRQRVLEVARIPAIAKPANRKRRKRRLVRSGRQSQAVRDVLPKLTDRDGKVLYSDGKVPDSVPTETVRQDVIAKLGREVGWHTVNRVLGRE